MKRKLALVALLVTWCTASEAQELLTNPSLFVNDAPPSWTLVESSSSLPGAFPDSAALAGFAAQSGAQGLWLQEFRGLFFGNGNELTSAVLTQTVPGSVGESYTFTGHSLFEGNYSGGVTTLDAGSPSGAVPSPTQTYFEMAFLDGGGATIGAPVTLDLRTDQSNGGGWKQHSLGGVAPAGTTNVRVTAAAIDMIPNVDPQQSAFFDDFSLTGASAPTAELLANNDLEVVPPSGADGWTVSGIGGESYPDFAAHTGPTGFWVQSYLADIQPENVILQQTVPGTAGLTYRFSGWSFFELGYSGGVETLDILSPYGNVPSETDTLFVMEFLNGSGGVIETASLDLRTEQMNDQTWRQHSLTATAPAGTANIRVSMQALAVMANIDPPGGFQNANFDDFSLTVLIPGDFDSDGDVDGQDFLVWQRDPAVGDLADWQSNYGGGAQLPTLSAVPEPAALTLLCLAVVGASAWRRTVRV